MKKSLKRIIAAALTVVMMFSMSTSVFASDENSFENMAKTVIDSYFLDESIEQPSIKSFSIGEKIPAYELKNSELILFDSTDYYPVHIDNSLYGILVVDYPNDEAKIAYSFGEMFVPNIKEFISNGNNKYCIITAGAVGYLKYNDNAVVIFGETIPSLGLSRSAIEVTVDDVKNINDNNMVYNNNNIISTLPISSATTRGAGGSKNLAVGTWKQSATDGLCWAGCVECIGEYLTKDKSYSPKSIETAMGISPGAGAYNSTIVDALSQLYSTASTEMSSLSDSEIITSIDSGKPFYMYWMDVPSWQGHGTTCRGYNDTGSKMTISIMDTSTGSFVTKTKNGSGNFVYRSGGVDLAWDSSVVPD